MASERSPSGIGAVAGALRGDAEVVGGRVAQRRGEVVVRAGPHDEGWPLVGGEVPRLPRFVPRGVAGSDDVAGERGAQGVGIGHVRHPSFASPESASRPTQRSSAAHVRTSTPAACNRAA